ncbi:MAG: hypothetical protein Q7J34_02735 [Bacteroidales bacterium]|nr:hypothetical protein [Bacteroidales bacterium]
MSIIIGIGGVSRAGKSMLADEISLLFPASSVRIIHQDNYPLPVENIPKLHGRLNWEVPESLDIQHMLKDIRDAVQNFQYVIVEGLFAFAYPDILALYHVGFEIRIREDCYYRRKVSDNRWGHEPEWYKKHIWEAHFSYRIENNQSFAVHILDGEKPFDPRFLRKALAIGK